MERPDKYKGQGELQSENIPLIPAFSPEGRRCSEASYISPHID
jgi:hypothetical protein